MARWRYSRLMSAPLQVELLTRRGCSLCDKTHTLLDAVARDLPLEVRSVDIDVDEGLRVRYDQRIPVVRVGGVDVCEGRVTLPELRAALAVQAGNGAPLDHQATGG